MTPESGPRARVLVIDDDADFCEDLKLFLEDSCDITDVQDWREGLRIARQDAPDVVLLDIEFNQEMKGFEVLEKLTATEEHPEVIMLTGLASFSRAVQAVKSGAFHFVHKDAVPEILPGVIKLALSCGQSRRRIRELEATVNKLGRRLVSESWSMREVMRAVGNVAPTEMNVLITGETGVGKELVAHAIHLGSARSAGPFVAVNCTALPETLIESELFGHEKGAFADAIKRRDGKFARARGGTLLLDEVGDSSPEFQAKLLRVIEDGTYYRVGGDEPLKADVRVIFATNRDLQAAMAAGEFRPDLYHRIAGYTIHVSPLRQRPDDILSLANHFLQSFAFERGRKLEGFSDNARKALMAHSWDGNVRELRYRVERAVIDACNPVIGVGDLFKSEYLPEGFQILPFQEARTWALSRFKSVYYDAVLRAAEGDSAVAVEITGQLRQALEKQFKDLGLNPAEYRRLEEAGDATSG